MKRGRLQSPVLWMVAGGVVLYVAGSWLWWAKVHQDPRNVYWGMLSNALRAGSVTRQIEQTNGQTKMNQTTVLHYGVQNAVRAVTTLQEGGNVVKTENIGLPDREYVRYTNVTVAEGGGGQKQDYSGAINKWAKIEKADDGQPSLFVQSALGMAGGVLIPHASLTADDHAAIMELLRKTVIFDTDFESVKRERVAGRPLYTYQSQVQAVAYVGLQKEIARLLGSDALDDIDPNDYRGQPATKVEISVDAWSHQLRRLNYTGQNRTETYGSYGVVQTIVEPQATISSEALQSIINRVE